MFILLFQVNFPITHFSGQFQLYVVSKTKSRLARSPHQASDTKNLSLLTSCLHLKNLSGMFIPGLPFDLLCLTFPGDLSLTQGRDKETMSPNGFLTYQTTKGRLLSNYKGVFVTECWKREKKTAFLGPKGQNMQH